MCLRRKAAPGTFREGPRLYLVRRGARISPKIPPSMHPIIPGGAPHSYIGAFKAGRMGGGCAIQTQATRAAEAAEGRRLARRTYKYVAAPSLGPMSKPASPTPNAPSRLKPADKRPPSSVYVFVCCLSVIWSRRSKCKTLCHLGHTWCFS